MLKPLEIISLGCRREMRIVGLGAIKFIEVVLDRRVLDRR